MTTAGFDDRLYILSMDQDGSSRPELLGRLRRENTARPGSAERVIYEGFQAAIEAGVPKAKAGILATEECGATVVRDASRHGYLAVHSAGILEALRSVYRADYLVDELLAGTR